MKYPAVEDKKKIKISIKNHKSCDLVEKIKHTNSNSLRNVGVHGITVTSWWEKSRKWIYIFMEKKTRQHMYPYSQKQLINKQAAAAAASATASMLSNWYTTDFRDSKRETLENQRYLKSFDNNKQQWAAG